MKPEAVINIIASGAIQNLYFSYPCDNNFFSLIAGCVWWLNAMLHVYWPVTAAPQLQWGAM